MNLHDAIQFTEQNRDSWREGKGRTTALINARHVERILGGDCDVLGINTSHFTQLTQQLKAEGKKPATINRITTTLSTVLNELRVNGIDAPIVSYKRQKESSGRPEFYTEEEVDRMLRVSQNFGDYLLLHDSLLFAIKTGARQSEMLKLEEGDVNLKTLELVLRDTKNGKDHWLKIHEDLLPALQRRVDTRIGTSLFPWQSPEALRSQFVKLKEKAGLPDDNRCWHTLRHSVATWLCERNVPLRAVMGVLNHSNVRTTLRYAKASDRSVAAAIDLL